MYVTGIVARGNGIYENNINIDVMLWMIKRLNKIKNFIHIDSNA